MYYQFTGAFSCAFSLSCDELLYLVRALEFGEAPALVDARTRGLEQIFEEPLEGIVCEDSFQVLPLQLLEEVILEVVLSQTLGGKAGLGVFVSHDVRFSFDEGLDVGAEVHPFHDTRDAVVL